jgi:hypothetical protein
MARWAVLGAAVTPVVTNCVEGGMLLFDTAFLMQPKKMDAPSVRGNS